MENKSSDKKEKRRQLFELFSKNLQAVKQHPSIHFEPDYNEGFLCPICMKLFPRAALSTNKEYDNYLTLEDVPPVKLGGSVRTLTCKICNNTGGSELESHLVNKLKFEDAMLGVDGSSVDANLRLSKDAKLASLVRIQENGNINIQYQPARSNPKYVNQLQKLIASANVGEFTLEFAGNFIPNRSNVALIRIGYLLAFSSFGYGFVINVNLQSIRDQIQNPQRKLLPHWGTSSINYPDEFLGVNIVTSPKELQSFLVVFDLKSEERKVRYGVLLPGLTSPGANIYQWLAELPKGKSNVNFNIAKMPKGNYLEAPNLTFAIHRFWNELIQ